MPVAISLGSNLGDRLTKLRFGLARLRQVLSHVRVSSVYETVPVGYSDQPEFFNLCCVGRTRLTARQLLSELQDAERAAGRRRKGGQRYGPRELDMDLLLYGDLTIQEPDLVVPHPRMCKRAFVLVPLSEIAGEWMLPATSERAAATVAAVAAGIEDPGIVRTEWEPWA